MIGPGDAEGLGRVSSRPARSPRTMARTIDSSCPGGTNRAMARLAQLRARAVTPASGSTVRSCALLTWASAASPSCRAQHRAALHRVPIAGDAPERRPRPHTVAVADLRPCGVAEDVHTEEARTRLGPAGRRETPHGQHESQPVGPILSVPGARPFHEHGAWLSPWASTQRRSGTISWDSRSRAAPAAPRATAAAPSAVHAGRPAGALSATPRSAAARPRSIAIDDFPAASPTRQPRAIAPASRRRGRLMVARL